MPIFNLHLISLFVSMKQFSEIEQKSSHKSCIICLANSGEEERKIENWIYDHNNKNFH